MTDVTDLLSELVAIDSVNPSLVPGGAGEAEAAAFVAGWARDAGLRADVLEVTPGRPSVLVRAPGSGGGRTLLLCGHLDTVSVEGMTDPHTARVDGDRLHGRGAYDMKAGVAAALVAARAAAGLGLAGDVIVAAVADEEHASLGVQEAQRALRALRAPAPIQAGQRVVPQRVQRALPARLRPAQPVRQAQLLARLAPPPGPRSARCSVRLRRAPPGPQLPKAPQRIREVRAIQLPPNSFRSHRRPGRC